MKAKTAWKCSFAAPCKFKYKHCPGQESLVAYGTVSPGDKESDVRMARSQESMRIFYDVRYL